MAIFENILSRSIDRDRLASLMQMPLMFLREDIRSVVPSLSMTNEGPVLTKIFLLTASFICELDISDIGASSFDFMDFRRVENIRIASGTTIVDDGSETITSYKTARVTLRHTQSLSSNIEFVGEERDEWLKEMFAVFPASLVLQAQVAPQ